MAGILIEFVNRSIIQKAEYNEDKHVIGSLVDKFKEWFLMEPKTEHYVSAPKIVTNTEEVESLRCEISELTLEELSKIANDNKTPFDKKIEGVTIDYDKDIAYKYTFLVKLYKYDKPFDITQYEYIAIYKALVVSDRVILANDDLHSYTSPSYSRPRLQLWDTRRGIYNYILNKKLDKFDEEAERRSEVYLDGVESEKVRKTHYTFIDFEKVCLQQSIDNPCNEQSIRNIMKFIDKNEIRRIHQVINDFLIDVASDIASYYKECVPMAYARMEVNLDTDMNGIMDIVCDYLNEYCNWQSITTSNYKSYMTLDQYNELRRLLKVDTDGKIIEDKKKEEVKKNVKE